jgi:ribose transport system ATP-binding protein
VAAGGASRDVVISLRAVGKSFGSTVALADVSIDGAAGSIHAVTGENGAGKSTLMKLLAGVHQPDSGEILVNGRLARFASPTAALRAGVSTVFQELTLLPNLSIAENLHLGREPGRFGWLGRKAMAARARAVLDRIGIDLDPDRHCETLTIGEQQLIEIAKGVSMDASVFIFDEPTAALNKSEVDKLETLLRALRDEGKCIFYISHRLEEIFRFCDVVTVLKDGRRVATCPIAELTPDRLVTLMVGRPLSSLFPPRDTATAAIGLDVRTLLTRHGAPDVSFQIRKGEIVVLAGLEGQGQRDILRGLAGVAAPHRCEASKADAAGVLRAFDARGGVVATVAHGAALIPEDRKLEGLYLGLPIDDNIALGQLRGRGLIQKARRDLAAIAGLMKTMQLRVRSARQTVGSLSGGNQQKVMLGRWLASGVDALFIEEPTRGVDVGAKSEIYRLLRDFSRNGGVVLLTSSELLEAIGLGDRILVVRAGAIVAELDAATATEESVMEHALGGARAKADRALAGAAQ